jgi:hypothetical protein
MLYRKTASDTSIEAANSIDVTVLEKLVFEAILSSGKLGMTQDDLLSAFPDMSYSSITARPASLKRKGLVVDSGQRRAGRSGRNQAVLIATELV